MTTSSQPEAFADLVAKVDAICEDVGRDPVTLGRSIGVVVAAPGSEPRGLLADYDPIRGSVDQIVDTFSRFSAMGCNRVEVMAPGGQEETIEGLAPVLDELRRA